MPRRRPHAPDDLSGRTRRRFVRLASNDADHSMDRDQIMTHALQHERFSIGIGCSPRASSEDVVRLVKASIDPIPSDTILATIDRRASTGELVAAALGLRLFL